MPGHAPLSDAFQEPISPVARTASKVVDVRQVAGEVRGRERWFGMLAHAPNVGEALVVFTAPCGVLRTTEIERVFTDESSGQLYVQTARCLYVVTPLAQ